MSAPSRPGRLTAALTAVGENPYVAAVRAGMVAVVPLTIVGGVFIIAANLPIPGWTGRVAQYGPLLQIPVTATFGLLALVACFSIAHELARSLKQDPLVSATIATVVFLLLRIDPSSGEFRAEGLGSAGLFPAILVALVTVPVQRFLAARNLVIRLPSSVPPVVAQSFLSLVPLFVLVTAAWLLRFAAGLDIDAAVRALVAPVVFALNTLPGILAYAWVVTMLWSVGINGDNAVDAVVAPVFLQYLSANALAAAAGQPPPYVTAYGFFTTFVNVGGTGATLGLTLLLLRSKDPAFRKVSRLALPTQIFQINEPIFFGLPIVLNPVFMVPYVLTALILTASTYLLMQAGAIARPFVNVPWTTPPVLGHYLVTGGDWRASLWGVASIAIAIVVYLPFARLAERQRLRMGAAPLEAGV